MTPKGAHSHSPGWRFNSLIYQDISLCINGWWLNEINGLCNEPGKWECAPPKVLYTF